ncbi:hypothetical protein [Desulfocurvus sp. DL9XJH121]
MSDKSVSEAVRELEQLRDEGYLGEEQFRREMRELLERVENGPPAPAEPEAAAPPKSPPAPKPAPAPRPKPAEPGRVLVRGKVPWDDAGGARVRLSAPRQTDDESGNGPVTVGPGIKPLNPVQREHLARMAVRTNKALSQRRDPNVAFLLSLLLPGLGQTYFGDYGSGVLLMLLGGAGWIGVVMQEWWVLYVLAPLCLLSGALAQRSVQAKNRYLDQRNLMEARVRKEESRLNVEKSIRQAGAPPARPR